jgi:hypothetical protein
MDPLLMDDPALVAAIQKLDLPADSPDDDRFNQRRTLVEWATEEGIVLSPPDDSGDASPFAPLPPPLPTKNGQDERIEPPVPAERPMNPSTFLTLMFAGAAGAALVFHDRVLQIISHL